MKLLIVDDEKLTCEGIRQHIQWEKFGISEVFQADDGKHGLEIIRKVRPEIVLTDVRMPRMNGIEMAEKTQELFPETSIIFMSGYSDKKYLQAAIKLKAIRYVEKPIDLSEVEEAIREAIVNLEILQRTKKLELRQYHEERGQLALALIYEFAIEKPEVRNLISSLKLNLSEKSVFTTIIIEFLSPILELRETEIKDLIKTFTDIAATQKRKLIYGIKGGCYLVIHLYSQGGESNRVNRYLCEFWQQKLSEYGKFFIAMGKNVNGVSSLFKSYNSAVLLLQSGFFHEENSILIEQDQSETSTFLENRLVEWKQALQARQKEKSIEIIDNMYEELYKTQNMLPSQVKDIYYKYFMQIENALFQNFAISSAPVQEEKTIWGKIETCKTLNELSRLLEHQTVQYYEICKEGSQENQIVSQIKDFIRKNFAMTSLSVKEISEQVYLSPSYVCTLFKNETGQTLNQHITEYRLERAKEMLEDIRYKVSDISLAVGYGEGNYFGKAFKKNVGLSPSEYREKMLR